MNKNQARNSIPENRFWILFILIVIAVIFSSLSFYNSWRYANNIVYVDSQRLVTGYEGMQAARKEFELKTATWQANLDTLRNEAEDKIKEYESSHEKLSMKERALLEELIGSKQEQFENYQQVVAEKIKKEDQDLTIKVLTKVNDFIKRYGEEKGYSIIMAATQYGNIVYAENSKDITNEVLEGLNAEFE